MAASAASPVYVRTGGDDANCDGSVDVDYPGGGPGVACAVKTVVKGVELVDAGGTVYVAPGTYVEGPQVVIGKDVTIIGAAKTTTIIKPSADTGSGSGDAGAWILVNDGKIFNLSKVTLDGLGKNIRQGIRYKGSGTVDDVAIQNMVYPGYAGWGIAQGWTTTTAMNLTVTNSTFTNFGRVGILIDEGSGPSTATISGNTFTGKGVGDHLDYAVEVEGGAQATISNNTITNCRGVASSDGSVSAAIFITTYFAPGSGATITGNTLTGNTTGVAVGYNASDSSTVAASNNCIHSNDHGITSTAPSVDADNNWWGSINGPFNATNNPAGLGDEVSDEVTFLPWLDACGGSPIGGHFRNTTTLEEFISVQQAVDDADTLAGHTILPVTDGPFPGSATIGKAGVIIDLGGKTFSGGSPAFIITADDVTVQNGILDGWTGTGNNPTAAIEVQAGADNFNLLRSEVLRWKDGLELQGSVTSFKVVGNWFHDNTESGLQVNSAGLVNGVLTIEGNLFKENGGTGIQNDSGSPLKAEYNSWGDYGGPASGDGISADVDADPWTFVEPFIDVDPDSELLLRNVNENQVFDVKLKVDAQRLYGLSFKFTWDSAYLTLNSSTFASPWVGKCADLGSSPGIVKYRCNLEYPTAEFTADGGTILTLNFTANGGGLLGNGPWDSFFDISHLAVDTSAGAVGGARIWVNNAGYGAPSSAARDITDTDDGKVVITGLANYTGFVDLQGRTNDSGALVQVFNAASKSTSIELANASSAAGGGYTTAHLTPQVITVGNTYFLFVDRALYLPTTIMFTDPLLPGPPPIPTDWEDAKLLSQRPLTPLNLVFLLGGDAVSNDLIDILDAGCIGNAYLPGTPGATTCGSQGSSDVTGDGYTDMLDLTLMGGNFTLNFSPWTP